MNSPEQRDELLQMLAIPEQTGDSLLIEESFVKATALRDEIRHGRAAVSDIKEWYRKHDPIGEVMLKNAGLVVEQGDLAGHKEFLRNISADTLTLVRAGAVFALSRLNPELVNPNGTVGEAEENINTFWIENICPTLPNGEQAAPNSQAGLNVILLANTSDLFIEQDEEAIPDLLIAAEMLDDGARQCKSFLKHGETSEEVIELMYFGDITSKYLYELIMSKGADHPQGMGKEISITTMSKAIEAAMLRCSLMGRIFDNDSELMGEARDQFYIMSLMLRAMFDGDASKVRPLVRDNNISGKLHEAIWFLDSFVAKTVQPDIYGKVSVRPTRSRCDEPFNGGPKLRRGYDYELVSPSKSLLIQLKKSGQREQQGYHDNIAVVQERNFMDLQPKRLQRKLDLYLDWAQLGFDPEFETKHRLYDQYVLESVKDVLDDAI
jgi:hypothetical protein